MPAVRDVIAKLSRHYVPDEHIATAIWCEYDVIGRAKERGVVVTREQAQEILSLIDSKHDCEVGITWDTIEFYIDELKS